MGVPVDDMPVFQAVIGRNRGLGKPAGQKKTEQDDRCDIFHGVRLQR
jgi:hypothetical protein